MQLGQCYYNKYFGRVQSDFVRLIAFLLVVTTIGLHLHGPLASGGEPEPAEIHVLFDRYPGVQMVGFLLAEREGLYRKAQLPKVVFHGDQIDEWGASRLYSGELHFATGVLPQACYDVSRGERFVVVSLFVRHSTYGLLYRSDCMPRADSIKDFAGRRIGVFYQEQQLMDAHFGYLKTKYQGYPVLESGLNLLLPGGLDAIGIRSYELPAYMEFARYRKLNRFFPFSGEGYDLPEDCLLCTNEFLDKYPELCRRFVEATWKGWDLAFSDPEKAVETLEHFYKLRQMRFERQVVIAQFDETKRIVYPRTERDKKGILTEEEYKGVVDCMIQAGLMTKETAPSYSKLFRFIPVNRQQGVPSSPEPGSSVTLNRKRTPVGSTNVVRGEQP